MGETLLQISPADHGRRMTLEEFEHAEPVDGALYELSKGEVIVTSVPDPKHFAVVYFIKRVLFAYDLAHAGMIHRIGTGSECKILLDEREGPSERHPDLLVYKAPAPVGTDVWRAWVPELVIEVVSPSSTDRDYLVKPAEYLQFGIREYWIVDPQTEEILLLSRSAGDWKRRTLKPGDKLTTWVLPGLELDIAAVFAAAK